ncbi:MAG: NAD-glutamate dehydrogenase [Gammaproteobacteria bacterium]|nr:NAD-glutamate dehydrogenase [Gammaproteobacteria bacterium]
MNSTMHSDKQKILNAVCEQILKKLPNKEAKLCAEFTNQFFSTMSTDDIKAWTVDNLYGAALNFWSLLEKNHYDESKIKIYNPDFDRYGWQSTHTVIEVLTRDMPFLVESLRMCINRMGLALHLVIHMGGIRLVRNAKHEITSILSKDDTSKKEYQIEAPIFFLVDRQTDPAALQQLQNEISNVLNDTQVVVKDWMAMRERLVSAVGQMDSYPKCINKEDILESQEFLKWLENHHFTFLGVCDYEMVKEGHHQVLKPIRGTGYGILSEGRSEVQSIQLSKLPSEAQKLFLSSQILIVAKSDLKSKVHRETCIDYIGIKQFNDKGEVVGERRVYGLFTSAAYFTYIRDIPLLRQKVQRILKQSKLDPRSHAGRILINILETMPRDDLIQGSDEELLQITQGIFHLQDRKRIRLFARSDIFDRYVSCLVYVPKELYNTHFRKSIEHIFEENMQVASIDFSTMFSESILARIHFLIHLKPGASHPTQKILDKIEKKLIEVGRTWLDDLQTYLYDAVGEEHGNLLFNRYKNAFSPSYTSYFTPRTAVVDIKYLESLKEDAKLQMNFYRSLDEVEGHFKLKFYQKNSTIPLSDVLPIIENMGLRAISERPFSLLLDDGQVSWVNEFAIFYPNTLQHEIDNIRENFQDAFLKIWSGEAENDGFNKLVLAAGLTWRQVSMLRAYAKYLKQLGVTYSHDYIESALVHQVQITQKIAKLFELRFFPDVHHERQEAMDMLLADIHQELDSVENLDEDKIIRLFLSLIQETLRTNFFQLTADGHSKTYLSFKFNSKNIPGMPKPYPKYEIFVYSPRFEAVHLRCSDVARGGLRWSDRKEDFRTEVLGLMKAQQVKNAVIVPNGAKGGFVPKLLDKLTTREEISAEGVLCYQSFIRGLLDITDNLVNGEVVKPARVVPYDGNDPYLVVAADKGTATFSDYSNAISKEYNFWLGDAFASGGSNGYDHKKMGITAKGAWESVKRHFYYLGKDIQNTAFTVVGIGDMAGDVFGNGMLLSEHIQLVAAFNHMHIFLDPNPDTAVSFKERKRMFELPRSTWMDYNPKTISSGGGVFSRSAKFIPISTEVRARFGIEQDRLEPNELIKILLTSPVELLWSAGIGTFVKATGETNLEVGDRTNDMIRVNAKALQCKVVGEGGNLGFTQRGRIEFALRGGRIYTDFIDNSGGVSCSDKEVNIKILLDGLVKSGDLTLKQRDQLLLEMTDEVSELVLKENKQQTKAISLWASQSARQIDMHIRYLNGLEKAGKIDRHIEFLPSEHELLERKLKKVGLSIPEIAVLYCYSKILLKESILSTKDIDEQIFKDILVDYFPSALGKNYIDAMQSHPLKREIIATKVSNLIVNEMGFTFIYRLQDETGAPISAIVNAFLISRTILNMDDIWSQLQDIQEQIDAENMTNVMMMYVRLLRRLTRWLLRSERRCLNIEATIEKYRQGMDEFQSSISNFLSPRYRTQFDERVKKFKSQNFTDSLAKSLASVDYLFSSYDLLEISNQRKVSMECACSAFFLVGDVLDLEFVRKLVIQHPTENHSEALARESIRDELDAQQRLLTESVLVENDTVDAFTQRLKEWSVVHSTLIERWKQLLNQMKTSRQLNYTVFYVATRELLDLTQTALQRCNDNDNCDFF